MNRRAPRATLAALLLASIVPLAGQAQSKSADTIRYVVSNHGRDAGDLVVARTRDSIVVRYIFVDRNRGTRLEARYRLGAGGAIVAGESRPVLADGSSGDVTEHFELAGDSAKFTSVAAGRGGAGSNTIAAKTGKDTWSGLRGTSPWELARMASWLLALPNKSGRLLPSGLALRADVVGRATATVAGKPASLRFACVWTGTFTTPGCVWLDDRGELFAGQAEWFIPVRRGAEATLAKLRAVEIPWRNAEAEKLSAAARTKANADVVIRSGDVFDSDRGVMMPRTTVVLHNDRITAVGPAGSVAEPAGATIIDAAGKTVMPGMWEMHAHLGLTSQNGASMTQLLQGITTARDMASDVDVAVSHRDREAKGMLASPRYVLAGFIEGPQRWAGPSAVVLSTEAEARSWVARYDSLGYKQIKLYNLVHPDLVPTISAEAKKRGMRLSGHVPRGLSVPAAVLLGYDEIQHAAFLFSTFFQDSLYFPAMRAYSQVAAVVAPNVDVDGQPMSNLIGFLRDHHTVIDGTWSIWIGGGAAAVGAAPADQARTDAAYLRLLTRLHDAGVTLVPGTDNPTSSTFHRELQLYQQAGIPASEVLQIATIVSARVMKQEKEFGSIATGKVADIAIVNGKPATDVKDLDKVETVIRGGRVYKVDDLRAAVSGRAASGAAAPGFDFGLSSLRFPY